MGETYYDVLGVSPDATTADIRDAYRDRVLETHPDHNDADDAAEQFARVSEAESVLTDESERARYDRLGHDAYRRWGNRFPDGDGGTSTDDEPPADSRSGSTRSRSASAQSNSGTSTGASTTNSATGGDRTSTAGKSRHGRRNSSDESTTESAGEWTAGGGRAGPESTADPTGSHHARQRHRRRTATASETDWWFGGDPEPSYTPGSEDSDAESASEGAGNEEAGFAVHGWTDDVELDSPYRSLTHRSAVVLGSLCLLYPLLVYSSLSPAFPLVVNATVTVCTLFLVGYLLTWPRVALVTFGSWSLLAPILVPAVTGVEVLSLVGILVTAAFWVPFGIALAIWWVLRP